MRLRFGSRGRLGEDIYANAFEHTERTILDRLIRPGMTILDVGANLGLYTCLFARRVGPRGRVLAFEPTPATFALLEENVRLNRLQQTVECRCCALAEKEGTASMYVYPEGSDVYNSLAAPLALGKVEAAGAIDVPTTTMDRCLAGVPLDGGCFVKIDVEGFEHQVLQGGQGLLRLGNDLALMVELYEPAARQCGHSTLETLSLSESWGFRAYWMAGPGGLAAVDQQARRRLKEGTLPPNVFFFNAISHRRLAEARLLPAAAPPRRAA